MAKTATAVEQTIWDCRWSQPGLRFAGTNEHIPREPVWVCLRTGERRVVSEAECGTCPHWQREESRWN